MFLLTKVLFNWYFPIPDSSLLCVKYRAGLIAGQLVFPVSLDKWASTLNQTEGDRLPPAALVTQVDLNRDLSLCLSHGPMKPTGSGPERGNCGALLLLLDLNTKSKRPKKMISVLTALVKLQPERKTRVKSSRLNKTSSRVNSISTGSKTKYLFWKTKCSGWKAIPTTGFAQTTTTTTTTIEGW